MEAAERIPPQKVVLETNYPTQPGAMPTTTTFFPGFWSGARHTNLSPRTSTVMDLAVAAVSPEGLPLALIPIYKILHGLFLKSSSYNISGATAKTIIAVGALFGLKYVWDFAKPAVINSFTSSITMPVEHQTAKDIQEWLASQSHGPAKRHVKYTAGKLKYNKSTQSYELSGQKETAIEGGWFWFHGQPLYFQFLKDEKVNMFQQPRNMYEGDDTVSVSGDRIRVSCLGVSDAVLTRFCQHVGSTKVAEANTTVMFEIAGPNDDMPPFGGYGTGWKSRAKPTRDLCTIDLDEKTKADLISDIEHFWKEGRAQWYGDRGIPYRRGILMFGPPGTGKSSTCFAIAGKFAGALYSASMNEISDETQLKKLFSAPEKGDILLLEDIDSAGISREKMKKAPKSVVSAAPADGAKKSSRSKKKRKRKEKTSKISLAGLLGAIDTALNDGVVLIMTSNSPEALDKALIRPGRIDKQVLFGNISTAVAEHIFLRMYQDDASSPEAPNSRLARLATDFAFKIPDCKLTPAEVQGFLIPRVTPEEAVAEVEKWVEDMLAAKATGRNIVGSGGVRAAGEESEKDSGFGSEEEGDSGSEDSEGEGVDLEIEF